MSSWAIQADHVCHLYKSRKRQGPSAPALQDLCLHAERGEILGLLGPNGSGKTTLFRILSTALKPTSGEVRIAGLRLSERADEIRQKVGIVFQAPGLDAKLTVRENLLHHGYVFGLWGRALRQRADEMMTRLKIDSRADELCGTLSGGLKRRTELAKGLMHRPEILLLDEPSTGLDPGARLDLWRYLRELRAETGMTLVVTTHLMEEAEQASRVSILQAGRLVCSGRPADLKKDMGSDVVLVRSDEAETLQGAIRERFGLTAKLSGGELQIEHGEGARLVTQLAEAFPGKIQSVTFRKPTLEDVFLHHTGHRFWNGGEEKIS
ncbi:MAG: ABC transporter ATP-binding protein [Candidatus Omnitrophica bacterium]|nr:ABC transporter ATP-binding protein [Candidatus Omnitrophota bacterium]